MRVIVKLPLAPTSEVPSTTLLASVIVTVVPGSAVPVTLVPSSLTFVILAASGGVWSTINVGLVVVLLTLPAGSV